MKDDISKKITLKEKTLYLGNDYLNVFLFNDDYLFKVEEGHLNIQSFIDSNEILLGPSTMLYFGEGTKENVSKIHIDKSLELYTICSNLKVSSGNHAYLVDIYVSPTDNLIMKIERVYSDEISVELRDIYINEHTLHLSVVGPESVDVKEAGIIIYDRNCNIIPVVYSGIKGNIALFEIDLSQLILNKSTSFKGNVIFNGNIFSLNVQQCIYFKDKISSHKGIINDFSIHSESGTLKINVSNEIYFNPTFIHSYIDNENFVLTGKMNSNLELDNIDLFNLALKFTDGAKELIHDFGYSEDNFKVVLSKEDLFHFKNLFFNDIHAEFLILSKDNEIELSKCVALEEKTLMLPSPEFTELHKSENKTIMEAHLKDSSGSAIILNLKRLNPTLSEPLKLRIKNLITIKDFSYLRIKKNSLEVKFKTIDSIEKIKFNLSLRTKDSLINCSSITVNEKKTFIAHFKASTNNNFSGSEIFSFVDDMVNNGVNIEIEANERLYTQYVSDINELDIYKNTQEFIRSSKRYKNICKELYRKLFLKLPVNKNRVLFESFLGRNISGHPKYIYQHLVELNLDKDFELIWILDDTSESIEGNHKTVKRKSLKYYYYMATAGYWIFNSRQTKEIQKRNNTKYIQTWHGTPLKKIAGDLEFINRANITDVDKHHQEFFNESANWDYLLVQNDFANETLSRAAKFNKTIIEGYPANDILYTKNNKNDIEYLKDKLGLPKDKKVILYAPTWRDNQFFKRGHYKFNLQLELDKMKEKLGDEYIVLLRTHYLIANAINTDDYKGFAYNFSRGFDIQELYLVSDILITDYSSVMFDYANLKRPMIFFTYDLEEYRDQLRGFYFDLESTAPGPIVLTTDDVINSIQNIDNVTEEYSNIYDEFYNKFCHIDNGNSSKTVVDIIFKDSDKTPKGDTKNELN